MIITLAGRRIDATDTDEQRFPLSHVPRVKEAILHFFSSVNAALLVCSGACGADLIALESAMELGMECYMVLPFEAATFSSISVEDRPGNWKEIFDRVYAHLNEKGRVLILNYDEKDKAAFEKANSAILNMADTLILHRNDLNKTAMIVWDGKPKDAEDATENFKTEALKRHYAIKEINTMS